MPSFAELLAAAAAQLPMDERVRFIDKLWETVPEYDVSLAMPPEWLAMIEVRGNSADGMGDDFDWQRIRSGLFRRIGTDAQAQGWSSRPLVRLQIKKAAA